MSSQAAEAFQPTTMTEPVRVALVGCGRIAQVAHLPALEKVNGIQLVPVSEPSEAVRHAVARRYDVLQAFADHSQVLREELVEAVLVAAPDRFHYPIAAAALSAGKHVLVEKPLASTSPTLRSSLILSSKRVWCCKSPG